MISSSFALVGGVGNLYVDGAFEATSTGLGDPTVSIAASGQNNNVLCIGCNPDNGREFNGLIDDVAMWDRALSAEEVTEIYEAGIAGNALSSFFNPGDKDNDGLPNFWEEQLGAGAADDDGTTNPNFGPAGDPDNDGSDNLAEYTNGTDPLDDDSDDDTVLDGYETNTGNNVSATDTGTDPLDTDSDDDGTHDGAELAERRNPNVADGVTSGFGQRLVAYWNFDNNLDDIAHTLPGESVVADTGTFTGPGTDVGYAEAGLFGSSALLMNGGAGWVTVPASFDTLRGAENAVSVSAWFRVSTFSSNWQALVSHGEGAQWRLTRRGGENTIAWAGGSGDIPGANLGPIVNDNLWHHVVTTSDPVLGQTQLYVDGIVIATGAAPNTVDFVNGAIPDLYIGANPQGGNREWNGEIDDLAIWGRPITAEEVAMIYNSGDGESIENLLGGGGPPIISNVFFNPGAGIGGNGQFTMTFSSRLNSFCAIYGSNNLNDDFPLEVEDEVIGDDETTTITFDNPSPGSSALFFRIESPRP